MTVRSFHERSFRAAPGRSAGLRRMLTACLAGLAIATLASCTLPQRMMAVPQQLTTKAMVPDLTGVRFWIKEDDGELLREARESFEREMRYRARTGQRGPLPPASFLAVSGGGDNGAFGAGLLVGWTESGTRPEFKFVTGVSTGALIAPLAFLGPEYDDDLKRAYTTISERDVLRRRAFTAALFNDGMADSRPFYELVSSYVTPELLTRIGEEYQKGRLLFVGTTNLDAEHPVIWNMTAIAASGRPGALDLFRKILVASASIPGVFPPVMIEVEADGKRFQEMHVDGGTVAQVFLYPPSFRLGDFVYELGSDRKRQAFIIRNAKLTPEWTMVRRRTVPIAGRAVSSLLNSQGVGDLYRLYLITQRDGVDYNLAYISDEFDVPRNGQFDTEYMNRLFDYAYQRARKGYRWETYPPGFLPSGR